MRRFFLLVFAAAFASLTPAPGRTQELPAAPRSDPATPQSPATPSAAKPDEKIAPEIEAAEADLARSEWKAAATKLTPWLAGHPDDGRALFDAGYAAEADGRPDEATVLYRRSLERRPASFETRLMLGLLLARQGKLAEARSELDAATKLEPGAAGAETKAQAWRALAELDRTSNPTAASAELLEALKLSPESPADTLLAASLAEASGQFDAAEAAYRRLLAARPHEPTATAALGHLLASRQRAAEAEPLLTEALAAHPDDPSIGAELAAVLAAEDKAEALPLAEKLHAAHPDDANLSRLLARIEAMAGDWAAADKLVVALLAKSPEDAVLQLIHGQNLLRQQLYPAALAAFTRATGLDPLSAEGWSGLAFAAARTGHPELTISALERRARTEPENASTYFLYATAYDSLHNKSLAADYYHRFLAASGSHMPDQEWQAHQRLRLLEGK